MDFFYESAPNKRRVVSDSEINDFTASILIDLFKSRKRLGVGTYIMSLYENSGETLELCSGILSDKKSDISFADPSHYTETYHNLCLFMANNADDDSPVLAYREVKYTYLRVATSTGYIGAIYYDTNRKARTGQTMLMTAAYIASRYYLNTDETLRLNVSRMLEDEDLPIIEPEHIDRLIRKRISKKRPS